MCYLQNNVLNRQTQHVPRLLPERSQTVLYTFSARSRLFSTRSRLI